MPVRKINDATKAFTQGNFDVRIELAGDEKDEINELADSVNNMLNEVSATDKIKNDFITTVSHELRTPLTSINSALDIILKGSAGEINETMEKLCSKGEKEA